MNKDIMTGKTLSDNEVENTHTYFDTALVFEISGDRRAVVWVSKDPDFERSYSYNGYTLEREKDSGRVNATHTGVRVHQQNLSEKMFWGIFGLEECPKRLYHNEFGSKGVKVVKFLNWVDCNRSSYEYMNKYNNYFLRLDISKNKKDIVKNFDNLWDIEEHKWLPHKPLIEITAEENEKVIE